MDFWIVDVFAHDRAGTGNPLAVVAYTPGEAPSEARMQSIAFEFGFSETTFVPRAPDGHGHWPVRIFTPRAELPFAGHPALGTAWIVAERLRAREAPRRVELQLRVGLVSVDTAVEGECALAGPEVTRHDAPSRPDVLRDWEIDPADVDPAFPVEKLSVGPVYQIVPMRSVEALEKLRPPVDAPDHLYAIARVEAEGRPGLRARMFAPAVGVPEDPATGSAAVCLGRYLLDTGYLPTDHDEGIEVLQGQEMGRPSRLRVQATRDAEGRDHVRVGGRVRLYALGQLTAE